jgi:hypothetical protein
MTGGAIYKILTDSPEFAAIAADRVYPLRIAQGAIFPAVAYQTISNTPTACKEGDSGLDRKRLQLNIYSESYDDQDALAEICRNILSSFSGTIEGVNIASIKYETETDLHDDAAEIYFKAQDYTITINR